MATKRKTVEYWFPELASVTDNTDTNFTQITAYLPENSKSFVSVFLEVVVQDAEITANNVNRRQISLRLGAAAYTDVNNANLLTASAEQKWIAASGDFTSHFNSNWSGTSMTVDAKCLFDSAIASPSQNWRCATARLVITYDFDDQSTTMVKTVKFPLITPIANLATSKPGSAIDTIPAFDTWLPEASKTIRQMAIVVQGNDDAAVTTDRTLTWQIDSLAAYTTGSHEGALNTAIWFRHCEIQSFATNASHSWYIYASLAIFPHVQAWISITYEYNESATTSVMNSLMIPFRFDSHAGGTTNADYQRIITKLWIEEPASIAIQRCAVALFWDALNPISGIQYRVNGGAWSGAITHNANTCAGAFVAQYICDSYISSLARGVNTLTCDVYRTDTTDLMTNLDGYWIINYTSGKATAGTPSHNHTILHNFQVLGTNAAELESILTSKSFTLPDANYFVNCLGCEFVYMSNTTGPFAGLSVQAERLAAEGGVKWENLILAICNTDSLVGIRYAYGRADDLFLDYSGDPNTNHIDVSTARRYRSNFLIALGWRQLTMMMTYHSITFTISGTISGSAGGTVTVQAFSNVDKKLKKSTSRSGNGAYTITVHDDTEQYWVDAYEDSTHMFRSALGNPS